MLKRFLELYTEMPKSDEDVEEYRKGNSWVELRCDTLAKILKVLEKELVGDADLEVR